ncbi:Sulfate permease family protein [Gordonia westfalica]|uniref:Sulfate permease family protein n=1 Tax=Gordonia westfalica TaxID=158898 RepID=A0A1H2KU90_9ACTN|nr:Sulfate permease family protein [Gordonia westfalica]
MIALDALVPPALRGYRLAWLRADITAGVTLAAVAIPECMGYSSIAHVPVEAGLYTIILPTIAFALFGASRLLVVGADSATAALLASGIAGIGVGGVHGGGGVRAPDVASHGSAVACGLRAGGGIDCAGRGLRLG